MSQFFETKREKQSEGSNFLRNRGAIAELTTNLQAKNAIPIGAQGIAMVANICPLYAYAVLMDQAL